MALRDESRPTEAGLQADDHFGRVARESWLGTRAAKLRPDVLKRDLWDPLEREDFRYQLLLILENLQALER